MKTEEKIEKFHTMIGFDASYHFEEEIALAILELAESLQQNFLEN